MEHDGTCPATGHHDGHDLSCTLTAGHPGDFHRDEHQGDWPAALADSGPIPTGP